MTALQIEKLARRHSVETFDCGAVSLNRFLISHALQNQMAHASQTYVCANGETVIGYATLAAGSVDIGDAPQRMRKGLARHPVPVIVLARLAVDVRWHGKGVGASLLKDMALRTLQAADIAGVRAFVIHAKDEAALRYYKQFGFEDGFPDPLHLFALTKDLKVLAT